ncbi:hypothetical protein E4U54_003589, partial [Claviceps lovelessii]
MGKKCVTEQKNTASASSFSRQAPSTEHMNAGAAGLILLRCGTAVGRKLGIGSAKDVHAVRINYVLELTGKMDGDDSTGKATFEEEGHRS